MGRSRRSSEENPPTSQLEQVESSKQLQKNLEWDYEAKPSYSSKEHFSSVTLYQYDSDLGNEDWFQSMEQKPFGQHSFYSEDAANSDIPQIVPCTITICLALPDVFGLKGKHTHEMLKRLKHDKITKLRRFYHIEYLLLPDDTEPKQVDIVLFSTLTIKLFMESGMKVLNPWWDHDKLWVAWKENHKMSITKEVLKKLNYHKITLTIWDTKDRVSKKAKFSKAKSYSRQDDMESVDEVKELVLSQKKLFEEKLPKPSVIKTKSGIKKVEPYIPPPISETARDSYYKTDPEFEKALKGDDFVAQWDMSRGSAFTIEKQSETKEILKQLNQHSSSLVTDNLKTQRKDLTRRLSIKKKRKFRTNEDESESTLAKKQSIFSMELNAMPLLAGPVTPEKLQKMCNPVYCKYKFHDTPVHQTQGQPYGTHIYFDDINVILIGALDSRNLREYLEGPPMEVEIHDRDRKEDIYLVEPSLFGEDSADANLTNMSHITYMAENPLETINKKWDPYGIAKVSFADLLLGQKLMELFVPIHRCKVDSSYFQKDSRRYKKNFGGHDPMDTLQTFPIPMGKYLDYSSLLRLRVELCVPLKLDAGVDLGEVSSERYGRIIYIFDPSKIDFKRALLKGITEINAKALHLESYPSDDVQEALSAFKVKVKIQAKLDQDVITGFHLFDGQIHLFILEGLAQQGLRKLWEQFPNRAPDSGGMFQVLYNSDLTFHDRLYSDLDAVLYHIHLCKPLSSLLRESVIYVRGLIPQPSLQALIKLDTICHSKKLKDVIEKDLLPSADMVKCMSEEFGVPVSRSELLTQAPLKKLPSALKIDRPERKVYSFHSLIKLHQEKYLQWKKDMEIKRAIAPSYIQKNFFKAALARRISQRPKVKTIRFIPSDGKSVYNYSTHTFNSGELAKQQLVAQMDKEREKRFTYSKEYLGSFPEPVGLTRKKPKSKFWLTPEGFQVPGYQTSYESNQHPKKPDPSRIEELKEPWQENSLFVYILKPFLVRERMKWEQRHLDFDLYKKPPFTLPLPVEKFPPTDTARTRSLKSKGSSLFTGGPVHPDWSPGTATGDGRCLVLGQREDAQKPKAAFLQGRLLPEEDGIRRQKPYLAPLLKFRGRQWKAASDGRAFHISWDPFL
ncbi:uncharacterized protein CFAP92 isoform X2 [Sminthopsis crassicaudata]|uniref:uncharacterized protein CFAP92 isoform X2 n=1 Tax=Sminthopsis crassicaudata TaxID=9301 RepID=UPI003D694877